METLIQNHISKPSDGEVFRFWLKLRVSTGSSIW